MDSLINNNNINDNDYNKDIDVLIPSNYRKPTGIH